MQTARSFIIATVLLCLPAISFADDSVYQVSAVSALMEGAFGGEAGVGTLRENGDFGIGTLDSLDGEMLEFGGKVWQVRSDGKVYPVPDTMTTPFAVVKFFHADRKLKADGPMELPALQQMVDRSCQSDNLILAVRVEGLFGRMKVRSVPKQGMPFPKLAEAAKGQSIFELKDVEGTLVGFRFPKYMEGVNVPGYHFHFLSKDGRSGGHVLACSVKDAGVEVDESSSFRMSLPGGGASVKAPSEYREELERVEK